MVMIPIYFLISNYYTCYKVLVEEFINKNIHKQSNESKVFEVNCVLFDFISIKKKSCLILITTKFRLSVGDFLSIFINEYVFIYTAQTSFDSILFISFIVSYLIFMLVLLVNLLCRAGTDDFSG